MQEKMNKAQLLYALSNNQKRKAFADNYKDWGLWFAIPQLSLKFYKYDVTKEFRIIVVEYKQENFNYKRLSENFSWCSEPYYDRHRIYIQKGKCICDNVMMLDSVSEAFLANELMSLKDKLEKGTADV